MGEGIVDTKPLVLIVEDDAILALDLEDMLDEWNFGVCGIATSAAAALELAARHRPFLALVDVGLSGATDGIELALRLRHDFAIPSVFITGALSSDIEERAAPARPAGFLCKPYMPSELENVLIAARRRCLEPAQSIDTRPSGADTVPRRH